MEEPRLKGLFQVSDARGEGDYTMREVVSLDSSGEILGINQGKVILHFILFVQVIFRGHLNAADGYAEGRVLDNLEFLN